MDGDLASNLLRRAERQYAEKNYGGALLSYKTLSAYLPENAAVMYNIGMICFNARDLEQSAIWLERAVALDAGLMVGRLQLSVAYMQIGSHRALARARGHLRCLIAYEPERSEAFLYLALVCAGVGPWPEAIWGFQRALVFNPKDAFTHLRLSELLAQVDRLPEAAGHLKAAVELDPNIGTHASKDLQELTEIRAQPPARMVRARYPDTEDILGDFRQTVIKSVLGDLTRVGGLFSGDTKFFTMGSCFARNIAKSLVKRGRNARHMEISETVNSTLANRHFVEWLRGNLSGDIAERIENLFEAANARKADVVQALTEADVFIFTIGVAPCFFEKGTDRFVMPRPTAINSRSLAEKYEFRTTSVQQNVESIRHVVEFVRSLNPNGIIFITLSPVPLHMTFEFESAVVADCLSKSTLRLAVHEVVKMGIPRLYYWPSFEIVRWLGGHTGPVFGTDDGASWHISEALIDQIIDIFTEVFSRKEA